MDYSLDWRTPSSAYVTRHGRRVGLIRRRIDGDWVAHSWPWDELDELPATVHPTFAAAAHAVADENDRPRPPRPPLKGSWPRGLKTRMRNRP